MEIPNLPERYKVDFNHLPFFEVNSFDVGIYFLINKNEIVYIGRSLNLMSRIGSHIKEGAKIFDSFRLLKCDEHYIDLLENILINEIRPKYNIAVDMRVLEKCPFKKLKTLHDFDTGVTLEELKD